MSRLGKDMIGAEAGPAEVSGEDVQAVGAWENRTEERRHACNGVLDTRELPVSKESQ